jgi:proline racemase/trans-L-3-hydroxyproline dehydratase
MHNQTGSAETAERPARPSAGHPATEHPTERRLSVLYGVIFFDDDPAPGVDGATLRQRITFVTNQTTNSGSASNSADRPPSHHHTLLRASGDTRWCLGYKCRWAFDSAHLR